MTRRTAFWLTFLSLAVAVGVGGVEARDRWGNLRPCAQCKRDVRVPVGVEVPLHAGCRARYADAQLGSRTFEFQVTREQVMATKTQVTDAGATITGTLGVYNQTVYPILISAPTKFVTLTAGGYTVSIEDISTAGWPIPPKPAPGPSPPPGTLLTFAVYISNSAVLPSIVAHEFVYVTGAGDDDIERNFSISVTGKRIWREEATRYGQGRDGKPVFADDVDYSDDWVDEPSVTGEVTFGSLSYSGTALSSIDAITAYFNQHKGQDWLKYAAATNLEWSEADIDFSGMSKIYGSAPPGTGTKVTGSAGGLELTCNDTATRTSTWVHGLPLILDFSKLYIRDRDGDLIDNLRLDGPLQASLEYPASLSWSTDP